MKNNIKIIVRVLMFGIIGALLFFVMSPIFIPKTINEKNGFYRAIIQGFYTEPKNSLDVIFIGDSSIYKGISPIKIWNESGIASYNFASPTQKMWDSYYCIKEVLEYQKPKVIVLNVDQAFSEKPMSKFYKRHLYDNMPNSINKVEAITDSVQKNSRKQQFTLFFPLFRFHSRWSELTDDDFRYANKNFDYPYKGYQIVRTIKPYKNNQDYMKKENKKDILGPKAKSYLEKIKDVCKENNVELLLLEMPAPKTWNMTKNKEITKWANENEVPFLDLNLHLEEMQFDWKEDTHDEGVHMNIYGAEKISSYMEKYLDKEYNLPDHREEKEYKAWEEDSKAYEAEKAKIIEEKNKRQQ